VLITYFSIINEKIGNTSNGEEKYLFRRLEEIKSAALSLDPQATWLYIWYNGFDQSKLRRRS